VSQQLQAAGPGAQLLITGHSKGGALAILAALRFWVKNQVPSRVVTFAAPRAGDRAFADVYNNARIIHTRYEFQDDLVPHMQPRLGGIVDELDKIPFLGDVFQDIPQCDYESVGELRFINWSNQIEPDSWALEKQRDLKLAWIIWRAQFDTFVSDHQIVCKTAPGYMASVAPVGVCPS
jgi:triacylglycerol lipase